ncbi:MAG: dihydropteroate synthase [Gammaproteobacteria bacterium]|nr:dihydropteroate synthase [Gammaproteobacteria bacterium]
MSVTITSNSLTVSQLIAADVPVIMGILNVTPDSFSDGGEFDRIDAAVARALEMQSQGASIIDVGGESTRPGAQPVDVNQEIARVVPVIETIRRQSDIQISIDTSKPEVMKAAVMAGANLVNDVNALCAEGAVTCCAELSVPVCLMHMQGEPRTMQKNPEYSDVVNEVREFLLERARFCIEAGIAADQILLDPGFGFGKTLKHNLQLLSRLDELCALDFRVLVGFSRKSMLGAILDRAVDQRVIGGVAAAVIAYSKGARWFRVHDVAETSDALKVCMALNQV